MNYLSKTLEADEALQPTRKISASAAGSAGQQRFVAIMHQFGLDGNRLKIIL